MSDELRNVIECVTQEDRDDWLSVLQESLPADELLVEFDDGGGIVGLSGRINYGSGEGAGNCWKSTKMLEDDDGGSWTITYWDDPYEHLAEVSHPCLSETVTVSEFKTVELTKLNRKLRVIDDD